MADGGRQSPGGYAQPAAHDDLKMEELYTMLDRILSDDEADSLPFPTYPDPLYVGGEDDPPADPRLVQPTATSWTFLARALQDCIHSTPTAPGSDDPSTWDNAGEVTWDFRQPDPVPREPPAILPRPFRFTANPDMARPHEPSPSRVCPVPGVNPKYHKGTFGRSDSMMGLDDAGQDSAPVDLASAALTPFCPGRVEDDILMSALRTVPYRMMAHSFEPGNGPDESVKYFGRLVHWMMVTNHEILPLLRKTWSYKEPGQESLAQNNLEIARDKFHLIVRYYKHCFNKLDPTIQTIADTAIAVLIVALSKPRSIAQYSTLASKLVLAQRILELKILGERRNLQDPSVCNQKPLTKFTANMFRALMDPSLPHDNS